MGTIAQGEIFLRMENQALERTEKIFQMTWQEIIFSDVSKIRNSVLE